MARPPIKIDENLVKDLARIHCTMIEIASIVHCSVDTLERRFADIIKDARNDGKMSIRRKQFEMALEGNVQLLTWLGIQYLDQSHKQEVKSENNHNLDSKKVEALVSTIERLIKLPE